MRDHALGLEANQLAKSDVNREYQAEEMDRQAALGIDFESQYDLAASTPCLPPMGGCGLSQKASRRVAGWVGG